MQNASNGTKALLALLLTVPAPTFGILAATAIWPESTPGQLAFGFSKIWLISMPALWLLLVERKRLQLPRFSSAGMSAAFVTGIAMFVIIVGAYWLFGHWIDTDAMVAQIEAVGLGVPGVYIAGAVYWCTVNSILEEYVWRWFVFTRCEALLPRLAAVVMAGFLFTVHHIIALAYYFDWRVTALGAFGVFAGGTTWSFIYLRWRNLYASYVSHVFADLAVFGVGWHLVFVSNAG